MRLGLAAWGMRELAPEEKFAMAKRLGVSLMECSIAGHPGDYLQADASDARIAQMRRWAEEYGVSLECACAGNDFTGSDVEGQIAMVSRVLAIAAKLGSKRIRIFAGFASDSELDAPRRSAMTAALRRCAAEAGALGLTAAVETHGGVARASGSAVRHFASFTTRADSWPEIFQTGAEMLYDPANLDAAGVLAPELFYERFAGHIAIVHFKDFRRTADGVGPAACGEGGLNWARLREVMRDYDGPALVEYEMPEDVEDGFRRSLKFLKDAGFGVK